MTDPETVARGLTPKQRDRLIAWPETGSIFIGHPDEIAQELCALGIGVIMPWSGPHTGRRPKLKGCCQMGLTQIGRAVHSAVRTLLEKERVG